MIHVSVIRKAPIDRNIERHCWAVRKYVKVERGFENGAKTDCEAGDRGRR